MRFTNSCTYKFAVLNTLQFVNSISILYDSIFVRIRWTYLKLKLSGKYIVKDRMYETLNEFALHRLNFTSNNITTRI